MQLLPQARSTHNGSYFKEVSVNSMSCTAAQIVVNKILIDFLKLSLISLDVAIKSELITVNKIAVTVSLFSSILCE